MKKKGLMQISELSQITGIPASTIRYYIREGLLPQPIRTGKTRAYYTQDHIKGIELIKKKQDSGHKSLMVIRKEVEKKLLRENITDKTPTPPSHRDKIMSSATELFSSKGFAETSIDDIVSHARMSKETFYVHFRNKEELFMECADKVFRAMYSDVWQQIRDEKDIVQRIEKRGVAFFKSYPKWATMMNLVRGLSVGNPVFREKFKKLLTQMINPMIHENEILKQNGIITRSMDSTMAGYFSMGMAEYGALLISRGQCTEEEVDSYIIRIISHGLLYK
ncbi:MerR family transcriptional regulator [bacterium]|nr:MerR family transcriptional regulator [bacterium]